MIRRLPFNCKDLRGLEINDPKILHKKTHLMINIIVR